MRKSIIPASATEIVFKDMAYVQNGDMFGENDHSEDESGENFTAMFGSRMFCELTVNRRRKRQRRESWPCVFTRPPYKWWWDGNRRRAGSTCASSERVCSGVSRHRACAARGAFKPVSWEQEGVTVTRGVLGGERTSTAQDV